MSAYADTYKYRGESGMKKESGDRFFRRFLMRLLILGLLLAAVLRAANLHPEVGDWILRELCTTGSFWEYWK